jgi:hypothetical protein
VIEAQNIITHLVPNMLGSHRAGSGFIVRGDLVGIAIHHSFGKDVRWTLVSEHRQQCKHKLCSGRAIIAETEESMYIVLDERLHEEVSRQIHACSQ